MTSLHASSSRRPNHPIPSSDTKQRSQNIKLRQQQRQRSHTVSKSSPRTLANHAMTTQDWASHFWITLVDEEGETFYANPQTGERKWTIPPGSLVLPRSADGEWYELWSDEHQLPYYYHTVKNETTWYKPDGFVIPLKAVQRFSAGKRFSLSLDSGSTVAAPEAPEIPDVKPPLSDYAAEKEDAGTCDPFYAAVFSCITGNIAPDSPIQTTPRTRTKSKSKHHETAAAPLQHDTIVISNHFQDSLDEEDNLEHANISSISMTSSSATASTSASTPLHTPKALQEGFSSPITHCDDCSDFVQESPYLGIEDTKDSITITADDLISVLPSLVPKSKTVAPLKIRKKESSPKLGEPVSLASPMTEEIVKKKRNTPTLDTRTTFDDTVAVSSPKTPATPKTPNTPRSPSAFFAAMFNRLPMSPELAARSNAIAALVSVDDHQMSTPNVSEAEVSFNSIPSVDTSRSPETIRVGKDGKSPTLDKVKKMFATSQDLFKQGEVSPKEIRRSVSELLPTQGAGNGTPALSPAPPTPVKSQTAVPQDLLDEIHRFSFNQYAQEHFATSVKRHTRIFNRKAVPLEQRMKWQAGDLEAPILQLNKQLRWDAQQCFTHLQRVMGDRPLKDSDVRISMEDVNAPSAWDSATTEEARKLLSLGVNNAELRDEIYVQLLCQLSDNPSAISIYRGYQLLQVLLIVFPPSPSLAPTLRQFLIARRGSVPRSRLGIIARYALIKLEETISKGPRGTVPTLFEIQAASEGAFQPSVFGESLQRIMALQTDAYPDAKIPIVLSFLADGVLALGGLKTPGIFRVAGDLDKVKELRIIIDQGRYSFAGYEDPRIAASLFKLWLRELRDPLIPIDWYHQCMEAAPSPSRCIEIIQRLPSVNRRIVAFVISFLQIFAQEAVSRTTLVSTASLAMIFTPSFFRGPSATKTTNAAISGTHDNISKVFNEARIEQQFMLNLVEFLDVTRLEDEDDWIPTHGKHNSLASSLSSSTSSSYYPSSSAFPELGIEEIPSRPSLDSTTSTMSQSTQASFGSTKRKNRLNRTRMQTATAEISSIAYGNEQADMSGLSASASYPSRSRSITDSFFLHEKSPSNKDTTGYIANINNNNLPPPLPDLPFIKPVIVVNEAD